MLMRHATYSVAGQVVFLAFRPTFWSGTIQLCRRSVDLHSSDGKTATMLCPPLRATVSHPILRLPPSISILIPFRKSYLAIPINSSSLGPMQCPSILPLVLAQSLIFPGADSADVMNFCANNLCTFILLASRRRQQRWPPPPHHQTL